MSDTPVYDAHLKSYYYDEQFRKYLIQFAAIFSGLQVAIGKNDNNSASNLITVPIKLGSMDRVVAAILAGNTQNKPIVAPMMSAEIVSIELATDLMSGTGTEIRDVKLPLGGIVPDDLKTIRQIRPVPYRVQVELSILTSNKHQYYQILEQILPLFDPSIQIQLSNQAFDWNFLTMVELINIGNEEQYPPGTDRRTLVTGLLFQMPMYLSIPATIKSDYINKIRLRVQSVQGNPNEFEYFDTSEIVEE